jgi:hypothetical protein
MLATATRARLTAALFSFCLPFHALGAVGEKLPRSQLPAQVCMIYYYNPSGTLTDACSGVIIGPRELQTAGHCLFNNAPSTTPESGRKVTVRCPGGQETTVIAERIHPEYKDVWTVEDFDDYSFDLGVYHLQDELTISSMPRARTLREAQAILAEADECAVFGYGSFPHGSPEFGLLDGTYADPSSITFRHKGFWGRSIGGRNSGRIEPGDSGGSLSCRKRGSDWTHLATVSGFDFSYNSIFAPAPSEVFLAAQEARPSSVEESLRIQEKFRRLEQAIAERSSQLEALENSLRSLGQNLPGLRSLREKISDLELLLRQAVSKQQRPSIVETPLARWDAQWQAQLRLFFPGNLGREFYVKPYSLVELDQKSPSAIQAEHPADKKRFLENKNPFSVVDMQATRFSPQRIEGDHAIGRMEAFHDANFVCWENVICRPGVFEGVRIPLERLRFDSIPPARR